MTYLHLLLPTCSATRVTYLLITTKEKKNQMACLAEHIRSEVVDQILLHIKIIPKEVWKRYRSSCHLPDSLSAVTGCQTGLKTSVIVNWKGTPVLWNTQATSVACLLWSHGVGNGVLCNCFSWGTIRAWILLSCKCSGLLRIQAHEWKWWRYHSSLNCHLSVKTLRHQEWPCEHS